jgi:4-diphosphocytidyl-2-C-methyl-D-erythritol kinase
MLSRCKASIVRILFLCVTPFKRQYSHQTVKKINGAYMLMRRQSDNGSLALKSYAKVAPYLDVAEPFSNGLWDSQSVIFPIDLYDVIYIQLTSQPGISIVCNDTCVGTNEENTCFKAARLMLDHKADPWLGVSININKNIPVSAGLGGGSSNATTIITALNILLDLNWDITEIAKHALTIGRDCYFFCFSQPCYIDDANFKLVPLPKPSKRLKFAIVDPHIPFIPNKARTVFSRIKSAGKRKDIAQLFFHACLTSDASLLQSYGYNFITPDLMPEYEKAFAIQRQAQVGLGINLVFSGTGPFLTVPFIGDSLKRLEELCRSFGANIFYANLLGGLND